MSTARRHAGNPLGDLRAEHDHTMLDAAFCETPDYRNLIESSDKTVVVGRRGSGKSALAYQLSKYWRGVDKTRVIQISLDKPYVIGLAPLIERFGDTYRLLSAGCEVAWRYCLLMEIALELSAHYKFAKADDVGVLALHLQTWRKMGDSVSTRLRGFLTTHLAEEGRPENRIADVAEKAEFRSVEDALEAALEALGFNCIVLIDRLDEGYAPNDIGVGFVDGIVTATIDINARYAQVRPILFLRDNMFRTIAQKNQDFSRNIEGQVLRLHWSESHLFYMACNRLRAAFDISLEKNIDVWNRCTARELQGKDGFERCLHHTLYRPRDILALLNEAFRTAASEGRDQIAPSDVEASGKSNSDTRLADLHKEYSAIFPGLVHLTEVFANTRPRFTVADANCMLAGVLSSPAHTLQTQQEFAILREPRDVLRALYGIGFVGIRERAGGAFAFCHDGRSPDREIRAEDELLIHPCYWMALNLTTSALGLVQAEEIHDEYDITVTEVNTELRNTKLNQMISGLGKIPHDEEGQAEFENWCLQAIAIVFAGALRNIEFCGRSTAAGRRSVRALNLSRTEVWKWAFEVHQTREVIFLVENRQEAGRSLYQACASGLSRANGRLVFVVTRDGSTEPHAGADVDWLRETYKSTEILVVRLTGKFLSGLLGKLRSLRKHDAAEDAMRKVLNLCYQCVGLTRIKSAPPHKALLADTGGGEHATVVSLPSSECYGELDVADEGGLLLRVFHRKQGPGRQLEVCSPITLHDQSYRLLEGGIVNAKRRCIEARYAQMKADGTPVTEAECEPPPESTFEIGWSQDDLAAILHDKERFIPLSKPEKHVIKTAISRLRDLVTFAPDEFNWVSNPDPVGTRHAALRMRLRGSGQP